MHRPSPLQRIRIDEGDLPAYVQVKRWLRQRIEDGTFARSQRLPSQHELASTLNVSRITIVRALQDLEHEGWVEGRQGVGTFVVAGSRELSMTKVDQLYKQTFQSEQSPIHEIVALERLDGPPEHVVETLTADTPVWRIARTRLRNATTVAYEEAFIPERFVPNPASLRDLEHNLLFDYLTRTCAVPIHTTRVYLSATRLEGEAVQCIDAQDGEPGLLIRRVSYTSDGRVVSVSLNYLPADASAYFFEFEHERNHGAHEHSG